MKTRIPPDHKIPLNVLAIKIERLQKAYRRKTRGCPFCGSQAQIHFSNEWMIVCTNLDCKTMGPSRPTALQALKAWNRKV